MKIRISAILVAIAVAIAAAAQPRAKFEPLTYDFGAFNEADDPVTAIFRCINTGDQPLIIVSARATCGCTRPEYPAGAIAPGDTVDIRVKYDSGGRPGRFAKQVYITTNADSKKTTLTVRGTVIGSPQSVAVRYPVDAGALKLTRNTLLLGETTPRHARTVFFDAYNATPDSLDCSVADVPKWLDVRVVPPRVAPGEQVTFSCLVRGDAVHRYGLTRDTLTLVTTPAARPAEPTSYKLPLTVTLNPDFEGLSDKQRANAPQAVIDAPMQALGRVDMGRPVTAVFEVRNNGRDKLRILRAYSAQTGVTVTADRTDIPHGKTARITITAIPANPSAPLTAVAQLILNDPAAPTRQLRLTAEPLP